MSKPDTWMPLYIGDYLQDTTRLTTEQHGAYLLLIMDYWTNGPLPDDDASLAQVTRLHPAAWKKNRPAIRRFFTIEDGEWNHKRINDEMDKASQFIAKQKANGARGGRPKKNPNHNPNESQKKPMGFDRDNPNHNPNESQKKPMGFDRDNPNHNPNESPLPSPSQVNHPYTEGSGVDQPSPEREASDNAARVGALCKQLRVIGIDAAPQLPAWHDLLECFTDEQIISVAKIAKERKPNERIHLHYLVPILNDPPKSLSGTRRAPAPDNFDNRDYGTGGRL